jgi:hypothetical protein
LRRRINGINKEIGGVKLWNTKNYLRYQNNF